MIFNEVHFAKFSINPEEITNTLPEYKPVTWPKSWDVIRLVADTNSILNWMEEFATGAYDIFPVVSHNETLIAFEEATDAMLFKISYTETH